MKVSIIGCGNFGSTLAYTLVMQNLVEEITLIDNEKNKATSIAYDLNQASPLIGMTTVSAGGYENLTDADIIVITAGHSRKEGDSFSDLTEHNFPMIQDIVENIVQYNTSAILLIATNPVDIMTFVALKVSGFPKERVIGMGTVIDTIRMRFLLAHKLKLNPKDINLINIGEHGEGIVPLFSSANVGGIPLNKIIGFDETMKKEILEKTKKCGEKIISLGGAPSYAPASSAAMVIKNIIQNTKNIVPISTFLDGIEEMENTCLSLPARLGKNGVEEVIMPPLSDAEHEQLLNSYTHIQEELDKLYRG